MEPGAIHSPARPTRMPTDPWTPVADDIRVGSYEDITPQGRVFERKSGFEHFRADGNQENWTPHIKRAQNREKEVKLASAHFVQSARNKELWTELQQNYHCVKLPVEEAKKIYELAGCTPRPAAVRRLSPPLQPQQGNAAHRCASPPAQAPGAKLMPRVRTAAALTSRSPVHPRIPPGWATPCSYGESMTPTPAQSYAPAANPRNSYAPVAQRAPAVMRAHSPVMTVRVNGPVPMQHAESTSALRGASPTRGFCPSPAAPPPFITAAYPTLAGQTRGPPGVARASTGNLLSVPGLRSHVHQQPPQQLFGYRGPVLRR